MLVEVSYVEYHTATVEVEVDDKYQILVDYQKTMHEDKWDGRHGKMCDLSAECASEAMMGLVSSKANGYYCNMILDTKTGEAIYEA